MRCTIRCCLLLSAAIISLPALLADDAKEKKNESTATAQYTAVGDITAVLQDVKTGDSGGTITLRLNGSGAQTGKGNRGGAGGMQKAKEGQQGYKLELTADAKVRMMHLPPLLDANGKKTSRTPEEMQKLKGNTTLPGYQAELSDLKPNQIVQVHLVKLKGAKGEDANKRFAARVTILNDAGGSSPNKPADKKNEK